MRASCETCGNTYDKAFTLIDHEGTHHTYDCMECAIEGSAPRCSYCEVRMIGHGREVDGKVYCSAHCAREGAGRALAAVGGMHDDVSTDGRMSDNERVDEAGRESFPASDPPGHY